MNQEEMNKMLISSWKIKGKIHQTYTNTRYIIEIWDHRARIHTEYT